MSLLGNLLDQLGPGLSLQADNSILGSLFRPEGSVEINGLTVRAAQKFAADHDCKFVYENGRGVFIRTKPD